MKLLAFDLDGTLVTRQYAIPQPILETINRAAQSGHAVTVITGRTETSARPFVDALGIEHPYGTAQGARVARRDGSVLFEAKLPGVVVRDLVERSQGVTFFVATDERFYVPSPEHKGWDWAREEGHEVTDYATYALEDAQKAFFVADAPNDPAALHARFLEFHPSLSYYPWEGRYLEVTATDAHKGAALERIAAHLSIPREDVIAFGDGHNDLSMLEWAGHGVAVGEFEAHHARVAAETIAIPEEHGVAAWLEANLL